MEREFFVSSCYPSTSLVFVSNYWLCVFFMLRERMLSLKVTLLASEGVLRRRSHG